jgi:serine/threonine protein kinase
MVELREGVVFVASCTLLEQCYAAGILHLTLKSSSEIVLVMRICHFLQDIKEDNIVLSFEQDGTVRAAKLIDLGMARMRRSIPMDLPAAPANPRPDDGDDATLRDDVPSANFFRPATPPLTDEDNVPVGMQAEEWLHSKRGRYIPDQHAPELQNPGTLFTPQSDLWAVGAMALHPLLFCCCSSLLRNTPPNSLGLRSYSNSRGRRFLEEFQRNDPPPTPEETVLFGALFDEYKLM